MEKNPVILIGGNHYNGLALVRAFASYNIEAYGIIIGPDAEKGFLRKSKYWKKTWTLKDESGLIQLLDDIDLDSNLKPVIISWSDGAAAAIDNNYNHVSKRYITSSISGKQSEVFSYMDKQKQKAFAEKCGLLTAKSKVQDLNERVCFDIPFPWICKPVISSEGDKRDIKVISTKEELSFYLQRLKEKKYSRILIQEYLEIDNEYDILGCINDSESEFIISKKIRVWPENGGPTSFSFTIDEPSLNSIANRILTGLKELGYSGLFDVDLFKVGGRFYFNEINWRNSALCYTAINAGLNYPVVWYMSVINQHFDEMIYTPVKIKYGRYSMNEFTDIHHIFNHSIHFNKWIIQYFKSTGFAYWDKSDISPVFYKLLSGFKNVITKILTRSRD